MITSFIVWMFKVLLAITNIVLGVFVFIGELIMACIINIVGLIHNSIQKRKK